MAALLAGPGAGEAAPETRMSARRRVSYGSSAQIHPPAAANGGFQAGFGSCVALKASLDGGRAVLK